MGTTNNYVLGRGSLYFDPFVSEDNPTPSGAERFFGDCMAVDFAFKATELDHYGSTGGVREIDASATLQVDRSGSFTTENISPENLAMFFFGSSEVIATVGGAVADEVVKFGGQDRYYQVGETLANPSGNRAIDDTVPIRVADKATDLVVYVLNTDYTFDYETGRLYVIKGGAIAADLKVDYTTLSQSRDQIVTSNQVLVGKLRFVSDNPSGLNKDAVVPYVRINPNGNFSLIGEKWQALQFDMKVIKRGGGAGGEALYIDGRGISA